MQNEVNNDFVQVNPSTEQVSFSQPAPDTMMNPVMDVQQMPKANPLLKFGKAPIIGAILLVILLVGGIAFKTITSSPKAVFKNSINTLYKGLNNGIDELEELSEKFDINNKALILKGDIKVNVSKELLADLDELEDLNINISDYSVGAELGVDIKNERLSLAAFLKGKSEKLELDAYFEDGAGYVGSNLFSGLIKTEDVEIDFDEFLDLYDEIEENIDLDSANYDYVIKAIKDALIKSLDSKYMKKDSDEIKIAGEKVKVTKFTYTLNEDAVQSMTRSIAETLLNDKDFSKKLSKLTGEDKDEIEEFLKDMKKSAKEIEFDEKLLINVYQRGLLNAAAGFDIKVGKKEYFHYYTDGNNIDVKFDDNGGNTYGTVVEIVSKKKNKNSEVTVKYNDEKVAELTVRELSDKLIDFDYTIMEGDEELKGSVYLSYNEDKTSIKGEYKFKVEIDGKEASVEGSYGLETKDSLDKVDQSNIILEDDIDEEKMEEEVKDNLNKIIDKDSSFKFMQDVIEITEKKELESNLNSEGMYVLTSYDEVKEKIEKGAPMVLFVGSRKSSYSFDEGSYEVVSNLEEVQDELDFYSYFYNEFSVTSELESLLGTVTPVCKKNTNYEVNYPTHDEIELPEEISSVCKKYPTIYFIKDGKVVSALRGVATVEDIKASLTEIGIN